MNEAISKTRELSRGLLPVESDAQGLMSALEQWAGEVENLYGITCRLTCNAPILIHDESVATHAYRIAQEAVNNAIKHGHATRIDLKLEKADGGITMRIADNGVGLPPDAARRGGLGMRIMNYRAKMVGGTLHVERRPEGGTIVSCHLPSGV